MTHAQRHPPPARSKTSSKASGSTQASTPGSIQASNELSLDTMLADEIVQLTMASDGVTEEEVRALTRITPLHKDEA
jgi:hypothetical protein